MSRHRYAVEGWGSGELWTAGGVLIEHSFDQLADPAYDSVRDPKGTPASPENTLAGENALMCADFVPELCGRIHRQLAGEDVDYGDVPLDLGWCSPFQRAVIDTLRAVPWGEVVTYGELATLAGYPGAARATGSVCAGNRFWLIVPCHRVVASAGLGGYGPTGTALKRRLLELEGVPVAAL